MLLCCTASCVSSGTVCRNLHLQNYFRFGCSSVGRSSPIIKLNLEVFTEVQVGIGSEHLNNEYVAMLPAEKAETQARR